MRKLTGLLIFLLVGTTFSQTVTLRDTTNQYDYIVITTPELVQSFQQYKNHKETLFDFNVLVTDTTSIYAEFNEDTIKQDNIRSFISYAGTYWQQPRPVYILIAGTTTMVPNFNNPQYHGAFLTDYYYTQNIYNSDTLETDFYVGRIPCKNENELTKYLNKVIQYEGNISAQEWENNVMFVCNSDLNFGFLTAAINTSSFLPDFVNKKFFVESDTSQYYGNKDSIISFINNEGCSIFWFLGHGSDSSLINNDYFHITDLARINNNEKYFFTFLMSQFSIIDSNTTMSNEMLFLENAGSIGGIVISGLIWWGAYQTMQRSIAQYLFVSPDEPIGKFPDLFFNGIPPGGIYNEMRKTFNIIGDPSLILKYHTLTSIQQTQSEIVNGFELQQNYPNPFNPTTKIKYVVGDAYYASHAHVLLRVYDVLGNEVATLVNEQKPSGTYEVEFNANQLSSGVYFYKLQTGNIVETKKMLLIR